MSETDLSGEGAATLEGARLWLAGAMTAVANFMVVLDMTIANVSVPNIAGGLAVSPDQGTWVITSYSVAEAIVVPLTGWLAQRFGAIRMFLFAILGFCFFSALCGLSPTFESLVAFRIGQGLCGGPLMPLSQTLMRRIFPVRLQPTAVGLWAMTTVVGPLAGPLLGGLICDSVGWPWIFLINLPFALLAAFVIWRLLAGSDTPTVKVPVDVVGLGLLITWVGAMQIMLDQGRQREWFASPFIVALAVIAAAGFVAFLIWELTEQHPIVDLRIFRHRGFAAAVALISLGFAAMFSSVVLLPLWLQINMGYTPTWAGRVAAGQGLFAFIFSPISARLMTRVDARLLITFGLCVMGGALFWRAFSNTELDFWTLALPQCMVGLGIAFFFPPSTGLALASVEPMETASAAGLMNFMRTTSGAFGTALITTLWFNQSTARHADLANVVGGSAGLPSGLNADQATFLFDRAVQSQAMTLAANNVFFVCGTLALCGAAASWLARKPTLYAAPPADH